MEKDETTYRNGVLVISPGKVWIGETCFPAGTISTVEHGFIVERRGKEISWVGVFIILFAVIILGKAIGDADQISAAGLLLMTSFVGATIWLGAFLIYRQSKGGRHWSVVITANNDASVIVQFPNENSMKSAMAAISKEISSSHGTIQNIANIGTVNMTNPYQSRTFKP